MSVTLDSVVSRTVRMCGAQCLSCWTVLVHLLSGCVEHNVMLDSVAVMYGG